MGGMFSMKWTVAAMVLTGIQGIPLQQQRLELVVLHPDYAV